MEHTVALAAFLALGVILGVLMGSLGIERVRRQLRESDHRNLHLLKTLIAFREELDRVQSQDSADWWKKA